MLHAAPPTASITLGAVTGGVSPYTYSVDGSAFTSTTSYTNLSAATYTVEVKDANGCTYSTTASVSNTDGPTAVETTITDAACGASNGSISLGAETGGVSPYTYSVDGSAFTSTTSYTNLSAATYTVEVKDANGCAYSTTASVSNTDGPTAVETTITDAACGASNGSISLGAVTGGVSPYTYSVDGSAFTATTSYTNLSAATYTVEVKDANGCTYSTTALVSNTDGPTAVETTITDAACGSIQRQHKPGCSDRRRITLYLFGRRIRIHSNDQLYEPVSSNLYGRSKRCQRLYLFHHSIGKQYRRPDGS